MVGIRAVRTLIKKLVHSVFSIPAHPFGGLVLQVFFGQFGLVDAGIWLLTQNFEGLSCWYIFGAGELSTYQDSNSLATQANNPL